MKILQLAPRLPYPLTDGGAIGIYNITKSLAKAGHDVTLVTFPLDLAEVTKEGKTNIEEFAAVRLTSQPLPSRLSTLVRTVSRGAYPIERRMTPEMFDLLGSVVRERDFDVVHVDHSHMGKYGLWLKETFKLPIVLRQHNFESLIYQRYSETARNPLERLVAKIHGNRLLTEEIHFLSGFDAVAAITQSDLDRMRCYAPGSNFANIPAGVDTDFFRPLQPCGNNNSLLFVGSLGWEPNLDALRYFLAEIFPRILQRIPEAKLNVIGAESHRISSDIAPFRSSVQIKGLVPDIRDYLADSAVLVVPLRVGGGMRVKLLEFFASGKAVVSTSIGSEGNLAVDGEHLLLRDDPESFAEAAIGLMKDPDQRQALGLSARALVEAHYSWQQIAQKFTSLYESVIQSRN